MTEQEYLQAVEDNMGFCTTCHAFTREGTEPDAEGYDCPQCGELTVMGAEQAMLTGDLDIGDDLGEMTD